MAIKPNDGERALGQANYADVSGELNRRGFMKSMAVATAAAGLGGAAAYYGYKKLDGKPIKAAIIGCGDEGCVLVGEHNPEYLEIVAICDVRPSNRTRVFDPDKEAPLLRRGLRHHYGADCDKRIKQYTDYKEMLANEKEIEAVIIATPLISHAPIAIDCHYRAKCYFYYYWSKCNNLPWKQYSNYGYCVWRFGSIYL